MTAGPHASQRRALPLAGLALVAVLAIAVAAVLTIASRRADRRLATVRQAVQTLRLPRGATELGALAVERGQGLGAYRCVDERCPFARKVWFVPVPAGHEPAVVSSTLADSGYQVVRPPRSLMSGRADAARISPRLTAEGVKGQVRLVPALLTRGREAP